MRINGISKDVSGEDHLIEEIISIADDIGVKVKKEDISVTHRVDKPGERPRPVLAKFISRNTCDSIMKSRKKAERYRQV